MQKSKTIGPQKSQSRGSYRDWRPPETPVWARYYRGYYGYCGECGSPVSTDASGAYACKNIVFSPHGERLGECGHSGVAEEPSPFFLNYQGFFKGGGKARKGRTVQCNCWRGYFQKETGQQKPCVTCHHDDSLAKQHFAHNALLLQWFHLVTKKSKDGATTYRQYEPCSGPRCKWCRDELEDNRKRVYGRRVFHNPGFGHFKALGAWDRRIGRKCANCADGSIRTVAWACGGCGDVLADYVSNQQSAEDFEKLGDEEISCPRCGTKGIPNEDIECFVEDPNDPCNEEEGCANPKRLTLFDVDVLISRTGGEDSSIQISEYRPHAELPISGDDLEKRMQPFDFEFLVFREPEVQAADMNLENPYDARESQGRGVHSRTGAVDYSGQDD